MNVTGLVVRNLGAYLGVGLDHGSWVSACVSGTKPGQFEKEKERNTKALARTDGERARPGEEDADTGRRQMEITG